MEIYFIVNRISHAMQILSATGFESITSKCALS